MNTTVQTIRGACPHDCPDTCSLVTTVENGVALRVQGNPEHPHTDGALCTKVSRYTERTYHPERLLHPLVRTGPKGSGQFRRVGWDEALDLIAERLKDIAARDPQAIVPYSYAGTMGQVQGEGMAARFFHRLGASFLDRTICASAGGEALIQTLGGKVGMKVEHFADSKLIVIWGSNSIGSNLHFWRLAQQAKRNGARLVCIDPRRTETAEKCHEHIALRPGTDAALALALMHQLITHDWLDHDYIAQHTLGWEGLRERALQWPPERAAEVCGIPVQQITDLARAYGTTKPAAIRLNYGMQRVRGGGNAVRAVACLPALVGAWREPAGGLLLSSSAQFPVNRGDAAQARAAGRAHAAHHQHEHHRQRPAEPGLGRLRPEDRSAHRLQQQPGGGGARIGQGGAGLPARRPVHRGARTLPDRHRRPRRRHPAGHHAAGTLGHPHQLRPHRRAAQPPGHRAGGRVPHQHRHLSRAGRAPGF